MTRVEKVVHKLQNELYCKDLLEVACGCAEFSICASKFAKYPVRGINVLKPFKK